MESSKTRKPFLARCLALWLLLVPLAALHAIIATFCPFFAQITSLSFCTVAKAFVAACGLITRLPLPDHLPPPDIAQGATIGIASVFLLSLSSILK